MRPSSQVAATAAYTDIPVNQSDQVHHFKPYKCLNECGSLGEMTPFRAIFKRTLELQFLALY